MNNNNIVGPSGAVRAKESWPDGRRQQLPVANEIYGVFQSPLDLSTTNGLLGVSPTEATQPTDLFKKLENLPATLPLDPGKAFKLTSLKIRDGDRVELTPKFGDNNPKSGKDLSNTLREYFSDHGALNVAQRTNSDTIFTFEWGKKKYHVQVSAAGTGIAPSSPLRDDFVKSSSRDKVVCLLACLVPGKPGKVELFKYDLSEIEILISPESELQAHLEYWMAHHQASCESWKAYQLYLECCKADQMASIIPLDHLPFHKKADLQNRLFPWWNQTKLTDSS